MHPLDAGSSEHDHIETSETLDVVAKALPDLALQPMTVHRPRHGPTPDCESDPGMIQFVGTHDDSQHLSVQAGATGEYGREIPAPPEPTLRPQTSIDRAPISQGPIGAIVVRQRVVCVPSHAAR